MKNSKPLLFLLALWSILLSTLTACDSFTEIDLPSSQLNAKDVFKDKATANSAMADIYTKIREQGLLAGTPLGLSSQLGLYTDELKYYGISGSIQSGFYTNSLLASDNEILQLWNNSYNQIYAANAIIEGLTASDALEAKDKEQLTGEALFIRALIHFYLCNVFGDVPYIRTTDYKQNSIVHRLPENEVYQLIKKDLLEASDLLVSQYSTPERIRVNKWVAQALLARVCLYLKQWEEASDAASSVLNQSDLYTWPADPNDVFLKGSPTTIWQLMPSTDGMNTHEAETFIFTQGPPPSLAISQELFDAFSFDDLRKTSWLKAVTNGTSTWYHANKYKEAFNTGTSAEYSVILRTAEQYLIRAEARAYQGDLIGAKEDLNKTRNLAGLGNTTALTAAEIIAAVLQERRLEFFTELGHRFFDLKRTGKLDAVLVPVKPQWETTDRLLPIPESEVLLNPNLAPQNGGY
ncbi:RagB/SusD family nutrient uptake outer membrane protein [Flavobacterium tructae]|uniref:RagB/SusD family nutrient uptake outer membrane protein n=1 Tax=Flavobacterium tructae TaxID=1114873 RepID=UPI002551E363|nr:RagB/SusD family nutrient uptake outer membrane protein [Flavobacterium tructae]MDL2141660.1 RagB/SusD family nutrient uptake outer membrane protein [Flavobacterium tructae]